jgi:hypothetical protein
MKGVKPDVITVGEVWNKKEWVATYLKSLTGCFNFELSWNILKSLQDEKSDSLIEKLMECKIALCNLFRPLDRPDLFKQSRCEQDHERPGK